MSNDNDFNVHVTPKKDPEMHKLLTRMRANGGFSNFILQCVKRAYPEIAKEGMAELTENISLIKTANEEQNESMSHCFERYEIQLKLHEGHEFNEKKWIEPWVRKLGVTEKILMAEMKKRHKELELGKKK